MVIVISFLQKDILESCGNRTSSLKKRKYYSIIGMGIKGFFEENAENAELFSKEILRGYVHRDIKPEQGHEEARNRLQTELDRGGRIEE